METMSNEMTEALPVPADVSSNKSSKKRSKITVYTVLKWFAYLCAGVAVASLVGVILFVLIRGVPNLSIQFLFGENIPGDAAHTSVGPSLTGTLMLIFITMIISVPIGILSAVFLTEYAKKGKFVNVIRVTVETLAAIPSIVYGLFGYIVFVLTLGWDKSFLVAGLTMSIMILPTIIRTTEESLLAVPQSYREGSLALGAGKVRTIFRVVVPNAAGGIVSGIILSIGRVISESAVLILTLGMVGEMPTGFLTSGTSLALDVYRLGNMKSDFHGAAAATSVVLIVLVVGLNLLATWLGKLLSKNKTEKKKKPSKQKILRKESE